MPETIFEKGKKLGRTGGLYVVVIFIVVFRKVSSDFVVQGMADTVSIMSFIIFKKGKRVFEALFFVNKKIGGKMKIGRNIR